MLRGYKLRPDVVYLSYKAIDTPSAAEHCLAVSVEIIGKAQPGIGIGKAVRLTTKRNARIDGMPVVPGGILTTVVVRLNAIRIKDRHADALAIIPVADVLDANTQLQGQPLRCSPIIRDETGCRLIGGITNRRRIVFAVAVQDTHREVGHWVPRAQMISGDDIRAATSANGEVSILIGAEGALVVVSVLRIRAHLDGMSAPNLRQRIAELRNLFPHCILPWRIFEDRILREVREGIVAGAAVGRNIE